MIRWVRALWSRVLRVPLTGKILGANLLLVVAVVAGHFARPGTSMAVQLGVSVGLSYGITTLLVWLALRPVLELERTAERVWAGDFSQRVPPSALADRNIMRLASTMNRLLDRVEADRQRIQHLAGRTVRARDLEREMVSRELRESFAQTLAGVSMQLAAARHQARPEIAQALAEAGDALRDLTAEMRSVAETLYPGTLEALGLPNAIEALGRRVARRSHLSVHVHADGFTSALSPRAAGALYHVAEEAIRNVEQHANASQVRITLRGGDVAQLDVEDDGHGVSSTAADPGQSGLGLFSARAVLALCGGTLHISGAPGRGTRVTATIPTHTPDTSAQ